MTMSIQTEELVPAVLTTRQAAQALAISEDTLRRWLRDGVIGGTWISDRAGWRIPVSEVNRILTEGTGPRPPEPRRATPSGVAARKRG
jgi:excisionase family DNA binding protein